MKTKIKSVALLDHLCRNCGGRVGKLMGNYITGGGNPIFICTNCESSSSDMGPEVICWCGFGHRGNDHLNQYQCLPFSILKDKPELRTAFYNCGTDPDSKKSTVGIVAIEEMRRLSV